LLQNSPESLPLLQKLEKLNPGLRSEASSGVSAPSVEESKERFFPPLAQQSAQAGDSLIAKP